MTDESSFQRTAMSAASADGGEQTECRRLLARKKNVIVCERV